MNVRGFGALAAGSVVALALALGLVGGQTHAQSGCPVEPALFHRCALEKMKTFTPSRSADGHPNMQGLRLRTHTAQDIEEHSEVIEVPAEKTMIVEPADGKIPYQPWALAQRDEN